MYVDSTPTANGTQGRGKAQKPTLPDNSMVVLTGLLTLQNLLGTNKVRNTGCL